MWKAIFLSSTAFAVVTSSAIAQTGAGDASNELVVVSATRLPTPLTQVGSSVTVVTQADIETQQYQSLPDVLGDVPGVDVVQSGGEGGQTSIFMRGANSNQTKILWDGIDISDPSSPNGAADISKLLAGDMQRVEVLRGPQSALYGSDAIGGVINIVTQNGQGPMKIAASAQAGSFDTFNQMFSVSGSSDQLHYFASLQQFYSGATPVTPLALLEPGESRNDDFYENVSASTKLDYDLAENFDVALVGHFINSLAKITSDETDPVTFISFPESSRTRIDTLDIQTRLAAHLVSWSGRFDQTLGFDYGSIDTSSQDPANGEGLDGGKRVKFDWQGNLIVTSGQTLILGEESYRDAIHAPISAGMDDNAGFGELQSDFGHGLYNLASIRLDSNGSYGAHFTWELAPVWKIEDSGTRFKASLGTGFKSPSLEQLYQNFPDFGFLANPNLKPETSFGYDAGVDQALFDTTVTAGVTWFHNDIRNLITDNDTFTTSVNIGRARTQGVESFIAWNVLSNLSLRSDYTYTDATDASSGAELLRRPRNKLSLEASWRALEDLSLNGRILVMGPQHDIGRESFLSEKLAGYTVLNVTANYQLSPILALYGRLENALDTHYQNPDGFLRPGIGAYGGIRAGL